MPTEIENLKQENQLLRGALSSIEVTGPDRDGMMLVRFRPHSAQGEGAVMVQAKLLIGQVVQIWREEQKLALS